MFAFLSLAKTRLKPFGGRIARWLLLIWLGTLFAGQVAQAQAGRSVTVDEKTLQALITRIDHLEARVQELEAAQHQSASGSPSASYVPSSSSSAVIAPQAGPKPPQIESPQEEPRQEHEMEGSEHAETERMDLSKTLLRVRGFGDFTFHGDNSHPLSNQPKDNTSFTLGQLNLFVTSDISDKFKFLSEIVFEAGPDNIYGRVGGEANKFSVDVERYLLQYSLNDYFGIAAGRYHTAIGYYNTAFHHSTWLQTTTGRPLLFAFEDGGGILPIHNVGIEAYGRIPSGSLGLHYVAEIGNGRGSRSPLDQEPVQNVADDKTHKAFNIAVFARPSKVPGLQTGFSIYRDLLVPFNQPTVGETILAAHAVYTTSNFEFLNEAVLVRHAPTGGRVFDTPGFYTQVSRAFGSYRPYFRYQYINASSQEPIFPDIALRAGPSVGLRYDASESVALKLQYNYTALRNEQAAQGLEAQVGFTF